MKKNLKSASKRVIIFSSLSLFLYGFIDNLKGVTLPYLLTDLYIDYAKGGAIQQGAYFGFLASTLVTGFLLQRYKHRDIIILALGCATTGIIIYSIAHSFAILLLAMVIIGLGLGFLDLVGIRLVTDFIHDHPGRLLNLSAFFHGLASITAPIFAGYVIRNNFAWNRVYQLSLLFVGAFFMILFLVRIPTKKVLRTQKNSFLHQISVALRNKRAWTYYLLIISYESIEIGMAVWLSEFLQSGINQPAALGTSYLSFFFLFLTIGRLVGSLMIERVGYKRGILFSSIGVIICLTLGIFGGNLFLFFLPLTGFFMSAIFPTTTASASQETDSDISLSLFFTFAGLGGIIGSWAIGVIAYYTDIRMGFAFLILMAINIAIMTLFIMRPERYLNNSHKSKTESHYG